MATRKAAKTTSKKQAAATRPLSSLAPPAPPEESIADGVRRQWAIIVASWVEGHSLADVGASLDPMLTSHQISAVIYQDDALLKAWNAAKEERAHQLVDSAGSWAMVLGGKDGVEAKLKVAAVIAPKLYGTKATLEVTGKDGGPVATVALDPAEAYKRMLGG
jgi:hypothetical protein